MTAVEWRNRQGMIDRRRRAANYELQVADIEQARLYKDAGIECIDREPGFSCWRRTTGQVQWYNTPQEAAGTL